MAAIVLGNISSSLCCVLHDLDARRISLLAPHQLAQHILFLIAVFRIARAVLVAIRVRVFFFENT